MQYLPFYIFAYHNWLIKSPWRYGWFSDIEFGSAVLQAPSASCCIPGEHIVNDDIKIADSPPISVPSTIDRTLDLYEDQPAAVNQNHDLPPSPTHVPSEMNKWTCLATSNNLVGSSNLAANISWCRKEAAGDGTIMRQSEDVVIFLSLSLSPAYICLSSPVVMSAHICD